MSDEYDGVEEEEAVGAKGRGHLRCKVQVNGAKRRFETNANGELAPGSVIRVSVGATGKKGKKLKRVARLLAFVDPISGELVIRMGMYDISGSYKGHETGPQIVWRSDIPVVDIDSEDE